MNIEENVIRNYSTAVDPPSTEKKRNRPHYKEMYESALRELQLQRRVNRLQVVFTVLGWIGFMISVSLLIVERV